MILVLQNCIKLQIVVHSINIYVLSCKLYQCASLVWTKIEIFSIFFLIFTLLSVFHYRKLFILLIFMIQYLYQRFYAQKFHYSSKLSFQYDFLECFRIKLIYNMLSKMFKEKYKKFYIKMHILITSQIFGHSEIFGACMYFAL